MYIPEHFAETDPERIASLAESHPFGMLVSVAEGEPFVSHLPLLFDPSSGSNGRLYGHMAKANPHWKHFGNSILAIFRGPDAYVSPSWYASPGVPTWNYAVVHMKGKPVLIEDEAELEALLEKMTLIQESQRQNAWKPDMTGERKARLLGMIVGFKIEIGEIRAKFKLSQNRPEEDRQSVMAELGESEVANLMMSSANRFTP